MLPVTETQHGLLSGGLLHHPQQWISPTGSISCLGGGGVEPGEIPRILGQRVPSGIRKNPSSASFGNTRRRWVVAGGVEPNAPPLLLFLGVLAGCSSRFHHSIGMQSAPVPFRRAARQLDGDYLPRFRGSHEKREKIRPALVCVVLRVCGMFQHGCAVVRVCRRVRDVRPSVAVHHHHDHYNCHCSCCLLDVRDSCSIVIGVSNRARLSCLFLAHVFWFGLVISACYAVFCPSPATRAPSLKNP